MSAALIVALAAFWPFAVAVAGCILHDIRWSRQCAAANIRYAAERARLDAETAWQAERAAAIAAVAERNAIMARRGGNAMLFEGIPPMYR